MNARIARAGTGRSRGGAPRESRISSIKILNPPLPGVSCQPWHPPSSSVSVTRSSHAAPRGAPGFAQDLAPDGGRRAQADGVRLAGTRRLPGPRAQGAPAARSARPDRTSDVDRFQQRAPEPPSIPPRARRLTALDRPHAVAAHPRGAPRGDNRSARVAGPRGGTREATRQGGRRGGGGTRRRRERSAVGASKRDPGRRRGIRRLLGGSAG